jgi:uncharacterized protein
MRKLAVITGASSGLGWEMALQLATRGYDQLLVARREERLRELANKVESMGAKADLLALDLADAAERRKLIAAIENEQERLALFINNAGFGAARAALDVARPRSLEMIELNVVALTELTLAAATILTARRAGGIINVASTAAFQAVPYMSVYAATKAFVLSFTEGMAEELRDSGVRIMALCPGYTATEFQRVAGERAEKARGYPMMSAEKCVRIGLADYEAGKRISVTGMSNKMQTFASWLIPRGMVSRLAGNMVKTRIS